MLGMAATGVLFTVLNAAMKKLAHELDPWLVGFLRYLLGATVILAPALRRGGRGLWAKAPKLPLGGGLAGISTGILLMLASAPVFAGSFLIAKVLTRHERSDVMVLWQHLLVSLLLAPFALLWWMPPSAGQWALLGMCGFIGDGGR